MVLSGIQPHGGSQNGKAGAKDTHDELALGVLQVTTVWLGFVPEYGSKRANRVEWPDISQRRANPGQ